MELRRESFWQERWRSAGLARAEPRHDREKFYSVVAYPGTSGFLHVGHFRGLVYADSLNRFQRMLGKSVFFPTGTHASGLPAVTFAQKVRERDPLTIRQLEDNAVPKTEWPALEEPLAAARFLGRSYLELFGRLGILVDERAYVTTVDDDYQAFIGWQFRRLAARGALVQAPHFSSVCPVCGPVSVDASETDLSEGGDAEKITYRTVPFRLDDGRVLLAATLRPETVYGVTNLWLHPTEPLIVWHHKEVEYLVGGVAAPRLVEQHGGRLGNRVAPEGLFGRSVSVPLTGEKVPVVGSLLVDPRVGTGVVMSVPAHAPADWLAVAALSPELRARLPAIREIVSFPPLEELAASERELLGGTGSPAERALRATGAARLEDEEALEEATQRLYRLEFQRGRMTVHALEGLDVAPARDRVARELATAHAGLDLLEFSKRVVCRNGHEVVIRRVPDQWFVRYGDEEWKSKTRALLSRMSIFPAEYGRELPQVLDWYDDRPCTRRGRWLGTPFPADPSWVIEPIADSTFYPAYYVVRPFVASGKVPLSALSDAFFDRVFLGEGAGEPSLPRELQEEVRAAFTHWYPLDVNIGGKEHKRVHFPVFLYTHALLLPEALQPKALFVHWWVTGGGEKISKKQVSSKGGAIPPIRQAISEYGADALRLFYLTAASPGQDVEWETRVVEAARIRLADVERLVREMRSGGSGAAPELDAWLFSELHEVVRRSREAYAAYQFRDAAELAIGHVPSLVRRYLVRGGAPGPGLERASDLWVRLLSPIAPHLAEELGEGRFDSLVAAQPFPSTDELALDDRAKAAEAYLQQVEDDLQHVLGPSITRGDVPGEVIFYVAAGWKTEVEGWLRELTELRSGTVPVKEVMARAQAHPEVSAFRGEIPRYVQRVAPLLRSESPAPKVDEAHVLRSATGYLLRRFRFTQMSVYAENESEPHDPLGRRERSRPGRPAFYLVPGGAHKP
ncbi:MAG: class I tRNA ligase family protein [Thermoplasmata archaeon]|nr:class I tRNA ligase family protein [Thermoplasmata archaeon]